jgi:hypothetical protein
VLLEFVPHPVIPSEIVWIIKHVSMKNVFQDVLEIINVLNFMNVVEAFVL